jgi:DNA-binding transcriptional ArsR family regulator
LRKSDLIIHPVRFRILRVMGQDAVTTQEIADRLPDVPKSSIYRHLKLLLEGDMVMVTETKLVNGIQEKVYQLAQRPYLSAEDMADLSAEEHIQYFTTYVMSLVQDFAVYVSDAEGNGGKVDMLADRTGYTEVEFYATLAELDQLNVELNTAFLKLINNPPGNGRQKHKFSIVTHPIREDV